MNETKSKLKKRIEEKLYPFLEKKGFARAFSPSANRVGLYDFFRDRDGTTDVFTIQWEKHGYAAFKVPLGKGPSEALKRLWGKVQSKEDAIEFKPCSEGVVLYPSRFQSLQFGWFRVNIFGKLFKDDPYSDVAGKVIELFPECEDWWRTGLVGPHLRIDNFELQAVKNLENEH